MEVKHIPADKYGRRIMNKTIAYDQHDLDGLYQLLSWVIGFEAGSKVKVPGASSLSSLYRML